MLVFFDLDHTLLKKSSGELYGRYLFKKGVLSFTDMVMTIWWSLEHRLNILDIQSFLERSSTWIAGKTEAWIRKTCEDCVRDYFQPFLYAEGLKKIAEHRKKGDSLFLLSASSRYILEPLVKLLKMDGYLATELEVKRGIFTGNLLKPFCYGAGKLEKLQAFCKAKHIALKDCAYYGDSFSDIPVLEAVGHPVAVNPDARLKERAIKEGWTIVMF